MVKRLALFVLFCSLFSPVFAEGVPLQKAQLDLSQEIKAPREGHLKIWDDSATGIYDVNSRFWSFEGKPWLPVMGEMHYSRYPNANWAEQIQKIKASGVSIIATYVFWNYHETSQGVWNWNGDRDLRRFVELCAANEMRVWLRIGPYCNAEAVNGGLPSWATKPGKRNNNEWYQKLVTPYYQAVGNQVQGLLFKDGGPIMAIQLENEYDNSPLHRKDHIDWLREEAVAAGMIVPFYSITGNTVFHDDQYGYLPLQGGYCYRGWEKNGGGVVPGFAYDNDKWAIEEALGELYYDIEAYPRGLCEQGTGSPMKSNNRFYVDSNIIYSYTQNQIGRGINLLGYYMYQGGTHPVGLNRSIEGWPLNYDFQAPYSQFGKRQTSQGQLKSLHLFLNSFGEQLAPASVYRAKIQVKDPNNTKDLRYAGRFTGESGFVFINNAQVRLQLPERNIKVELKFKDSKLNFPSSDLILKNNETAILPVNLNMDGIELKYSTLQLLTKVSNPEQVDYYFFPTTSSIQEFAFDSNLQVMNAEGFTELSLDQLTLFQVQKGGRSFLSLKNSSGKSIRLIVLSYKEAMNSWHYCSQSGSEYLLLTDDQTELMFQNKGIELRSYGQEKTLLLAAPSLRGDSVFDSIFSVSTFQQQPFNSGLTLSPLQRKNTHLAIPEKLPVGVSDLFLDLDYRGGTADLYIDGSLYSDHFYHGRSWTIGLKRFIDIGSKNLEIKLGRWKSSYSGLEANLLDEMQRKPYLKDSPVIVEYSFFKEIP